MSFGNDLMTLLARLLGYTSKEQVDAAVDCAVGEWVQAYFTDTADASVAASPKFYAPYPCLVEEIKIVSQVTIAASNSDYKTFTVQAVTAGVGRTIASADTRAASLNGLTALVPASLTVSSTVANKTLAAGDLVSIASTDAGTSPSLGQGLFFVKIKRTYTNV